MALTPEGLTEEDGRSYAQQQFQRQEETGRLARAGEEEGEVSPRVSATSPTSAKLADLVVRMDAALAAAGSNPLPADDLAILNAAVVELTDYEASLTKGLPANVDVPHASQEGDTLNCTMGNWEGEPTSYSYQWQFDGVNTGASSSVADYVVTAADVDKSATCIVTATNDLGATVAPASNAVIVTTPAAREA